MEMPDGLIVTIPTRSTEDGTPRNIAGSPSCDPQNLSCVQLKTSSVTFITDPSCWLGHSRYFTTLFSEKWASGEGDKSFFIDCDSKIFAHILRYLRTAVLPVFYNDTEGHDFNQYHALLGEAEYLGIDRLCNWLRSKKYLDAVLTSYVATTSSDLPKYSQMDPDGRAFISQDSRFFEVSTKGHMKVDLSLVAQRQSVFFCPAGKHDRSDSQYCRSCADAGINGGWRTEDVLKWTVVRREISFDHDLCVNAFTENHDDRVVDSWGSSLQDTLLG